MLKQFWCWLTTRHRVRVYTGAAYNELTEGWFVVQSIWYKPYRCIKCGKTGKEIIND